MDSDAVALVLSSFGQCQKILIPTFTVWIALVGLLIGESHFLLSHTLLIGVFGTSF